MTPRTAIAQIAKAIGRELHHEAGPRESAWAAGAMLAAAGATKPVALRLLAEARRKRPRGWMDLALVARDLAGERPLGTVPLAARIAAAMVEAFRHGVGTKNK